MLANLMAIYRTWDESLKASGVDYYLKIWLFERNFMNSQVVAALRDAEGLSFFDNTFAPYEGRASAPPVQFETKSFTLRDWLWEPHNELQVIDIEEDRDIYSESELDKLKRRGWRPSRIADREYLIGDVDRVWLGSVKADT